MSESLEGIPDEKKKKKINSQQKHALRIVFNKDKLDHAKEVLPTTSLNIPVNCLNLTKF